MHFHPRTKLQLDMAIASQPHAIILAGEKGSGKSYAAQHLAKKLLQSESLTSQPYVKHIAEYKKGGIEEARAVNSYLTKRTTGTNAIRRVVILENFDATSNAAQNALLKSIEEPPIDTCMILTTQDATKILKTIHSRCTRIDILPLTKDQVAEIVKSKGLSGDAPYMMSRGLVGLLYSILENDNTSEEISIAKEYLAMTPYKRLCEADKLAKDKAKASQLINGLELCLEMALRKTSQAKTKQFLDSLRVVSQSKQFMEQNVNKKLLFSHLAVNL